MERGVCCRSAGPNEGVEAEIGRSDAVSPIYRSRTSSRPRQLPTNVEEFVARFVVTGAKQEKKRGAALTNMPG